LPEDWVVAGWLHAGAASARTSKPAARP